MRQNMRILTALFRPLFRRRPEPQIAAKADKHYFVYKEVINDVVQSKVRVLSEQDRVIEIAKMLSGDKPGKAAMQNAKELIQY